MTPPTLEQIVVGETEQPVSEPVSDMPEPNPKIHRPLFKQISKHLWQAPKKSIMRTLHLNPAGKYYEFPSPKGFAQTGGVAVIGFVGFLGTGGVGNLMNMLVDKVAEVTKTTAHPALEGIKDIVRISGEAGIGMTVFPSLGHNVTGKEIMGKAVFAGAAILASIDIGATGAKYVLRAYNARKATAPPEQKAAATMTGLGSLADLIKGLEGTAETAAGAEEAHTAEVADLSEAEAEKELAAEIQKFHELSGQLAGGSQESGSLMR